MTDPIRQILASVRGVRKRNERRPATVTALFAGATGTGKTRAAQAIANELGVSLLRVDLSRIVSKYIGETEKNLKRVFDQSADGRAVLLIEEAEALFGKRTNVRDAHDRYASIDVSFFVQRLEAHDGLVILTTNRKKDIDQAFLRRLRFIVDFPRPDLTVPEQSIEDLKQRLMDYLIAHPSACDTQEGIRDWWLKQAAADPRALAGTLADLEDQGAISRSIRGGQEFWHAPKAGLDFPA